MKCKASHRLNNTHRSPALSPLKLMVKKIPKFCICVKSAVNFWKSLWKKFPLHCISYWILCYFFRWFQLRIISIDFGSLSSAKSLFGTRKNLLDVSVVVKTFVKCLKERERRSRNSSNKKFSADKHVIFFDSFLGPKITKPTIAT